MNYHNFVGYLFLLLLAAHEERHEHLEVRKEEVHTIRQETALLRKESVRICTIKTGTEDQAVPVKDNGADTKQEPADAAATH